MKLRINPLIDVNNNKKFYYYYEVKKKKKDTKEFIRIYERIQNGMAIKN